MNYLNPLIWLRVSFDILMVGICIVLLGMAGLFWLCVFGWRRK